MNKQEAKEIYYNRQSLVDSLDSIIEYGKAFQKNKNKQTAQLTLFDMGMEDKIEVPKIESKNTSVNLIEWYKLESQLLGIPITYDPLKELWMYEELYCTHTSEEVLKMNEHKKDIVIMDIITEIEYKISKNGNNYAKIYTQNLGETYLYLTGKAYQHLIFNVFKDQIYLFDLTYNPSAPSFSKESININFLKNINEVDIEGEYNAILNKILPNKSEYIEMACNMYFKPKDTKIYLNR